MKIVKAEKHPAAYSPEILDEFAEQLKIEYQRRGRRLRVLDCFAGIGRIHELLDERLGLQYLSDTVGLELEPEWALWHPRTLVGSAMDMLEIFDGETFDVLASSPCYGNRFADSHVARDLCKRCAGLGSIISVAAGVKQAGVEVQHLRRCTLCKGKGLSPRRSYRGDLGRVPSPGSAAVMQWGQAYRWFHDAVAQRAVTLLGPDRLILWNISNHVRDKQEQLVNEWWMNTWLYYGCKIQAVIPVPTDRMKQGQNYDARVDRELIMVLHTTRRRKT